MSQAHPRGNESVTSSPSPGPVRRSHVDVYDDTEARRGGGSGGHIGPAVAVLVAIAVIVVLFLVL